MSRREQLRESELANPGTSARSLNEILLRLQADIEALKRSFFVDMELSSDSGGTMPPIVIAAPKWKVRGVYLAKLYDVTAGNTIYLTESLMWLINEHGVSIPAMYMPANSNKYALTFEVRG
jgi:hypothetical protein